MFRLLVKKYLGESLLLLLACGVMLLIFPWIRIWTISQFELSGFAPLIDQVRAFEKFAPIPLEKYLTYEGVIGLTFDEPIVILCILVWGISRGSDLISGEVGRGTMEMLAAQPVSRLRIAAAHGLVSVLGLAFLIVMTYFGLHIGIETNSVPVRENASISLPMIPIEISNPFVEQEMTFRPLGSFVRPSLYIPACVNLFGLGFIVLSLSICMSSWDQYRWRTIGVVLAIYVLQLLVFILGKSTPGMAWVMSFSFLSAYQPDWIIQRTTESSEIGWYLMDSANETSNIGSLGMTICLLVIGSVMYAIGLTVFCKRDLPAPL